MPDFSSVLIDLKRHEGWLLSYHLARAWSLLYLPDLHLTQVKNQHLFKISAETLVRSDRPTVAQPLCVGQKTEHVSAES